MNLLEEQTNYLLGGDMIVLGGELIVLEEGAVTKQLVIGNLSPSGMLFLVYAIANRGDRYQDWEHETTQNLIPNHIGIENVSEYDLQKIRKIMQIHPKTLGFTPEAIEYFDELTKDITEFLTNIKELEAKDGIVHKYGEVSTKELPNG